MHLTAARRQEMIDWLKTGPDASPPLEVRKARKVTLSWEDGPLRIDDEVYPAPELASNIVIEIEPEGLRVCAPSQQG